MQPGCVYGVGEQSVIIISFRLPFSFPWNLYIESETSRLAATSSFSPANMSLAPSKLFKNHFDGEAYPPHKNGFKVGMILEAIDPKHQSLICSVSLNGMLTRYGTSLAFVYFLPRKRVEVSEGIPTSHLITSLVSNTFLERFIRDNI